MDARAVHDLYVHKEGAQAISGIATLEAVIRVIQEKRPRTILEIGAGIGTITHALLANSDAEIDIYEPNEFCIEQLKKNLTSFQGRYRLLTDPNQLPPRRAYDVVIVDGGKGKGPHDFGYPRLVAAFLYSLTTVKTVIVEGQRKGQKYWILDAMFSRHRYTVKKITGKDERKKIATVIDFTPSSHVLINMLWHVWHRKKVY